MEQLKDFRLTSTPPIVWILCVALLVARIGLSAYEFMHPSVLERSVAWVDAGKFYGVSEDQQINNRNAAEKQPPVVPSTGALPQTTNKKRRIYEFYASWCSPCERLERDVMTNSEIRTYIEGNFCPIRVVDRQREDGHNGKLVSELQKRYRVFAFPTLVATREDGEALGSLVGNSSSLAVYRFLSRVNNDAGSTR